MIDPNWQLTDLDPLTWRNLGRFIEPAQYIRAAQPGECGLFVLHDNGRVLRVVDEAETGFDTSLIQDASEPHTLAVELFTEGRWDRVHIINKQHLANVARMAQRIENRALSLDQYYRHVSQLIWGDAEAYACVPPKPRTWNGWTYDAVLSYVNQLPECASVALGVFDGAALHIGLVIEVTRGQVTRLTTFEALKLAPSAQPLSVDGLDAVWQALARACHPPAAVLLCDVATFEAWLKAEDKANALREAADAACAFWRVELAKPGTPDP
jgi:hypothetical protein